MNHLRAFVLTALRSATTGGRSYHLWMGSLTAVMLVGGYAYDGAVKSDGSVWVWGELDNGMTGDGTPGGLRSKPTRESPYLP